MGGLFGSNGLRLQTHLYCLFLFLCFLFMTVLQADYLQNIPCRLMSCFGLPGPRPLVKELVPPIDPTTILSYTDDLP